MTEAVLELTTILEEQHTQIKGLMQAVRDADEPGERQRAFDEFRRFLAVHEAAEEACLHSVIAQEDLGKNAALANDRLGEEEQAGDVIAALEIIAIDSSEFADKFAALEQAVIAHAEAEEHQELPLLAGVASPGELSRLRRALDDVTVMAGNDQGNDETFEQMLETAQTTYAQAH